MKEYILQVDIVMRFYLPDIAPFDSTIAFLSYKMNKLSKIIHISTQSTDLKI